MELVNIGAANSNDAFYRYKMPKLVVKTESAGNGIKTNITNMSDVAKALARPPGCIVKFFGCQLGALSNLSKKNGSFTVNGAHDAAKLGGLLDKFIAKYVQCYKCKNPETQVQDNEKWIQLKCAACGHVSNVDTCKNDKVMKGCVAETKKKGKKTAEVEAGNPKPNKHKGAAGSSADESDLDEADVQWATDTSAEAVQKRREQLTPATKELVAESLVVQIEELQLGLEEKLVKEIKVELARKSCSASKMASYLSGRSEARQEVIKAYFQALFVGSSGKDLLKQVEQKLSFLGVVVPDEESQRQLLVAIEAFCVTECEACKQLGIVLKRLYDKSILEEDSILGWYNMTDSKDVKKHAKPFVDWLQTAESESSDED